MDGLTTPKATWLQQLDRIEQKLDMVLTLLAEQVDPADEPISDLDGKVHSAPNGAAQSLS